MHGSVFSRFTFYVPSLSALSPPPNPKSEIPNPQSNRPILLQK